MQRRCCHAMPSPLTRIASAATATARSAREPRHRDWLAEREADLLPVPYFHLVFTLPAAIADIAYQNKAVIYDLLFRASSETLLTIAADPKHLGARIGVTAVLHTWGSAMTHHPHVHMYRAGRRDLARRLELGALQARLLPARARALEALPQADAGQARRGPCRRQATVLRRARSSRPTPLPSPPASRRSGRRSGSSTPRGPSPDRRRCSPISRATPTASPSPTAA